jgi:hypothetical protein
MVTGLLLNQTVCFDQEKRFIPLTRCLSASWQRRCRRWLANGRIGPDGLYGHLVLWAIQQWQKPGQILHLALDTTMLWNLFCVVVLSVVCHGRAIPLLWQTLEHPSGELLGWLSQHSRWRCEVRRLRLPRGHCRGFRDVRLWDGGHRANLVLARPVGITAAEP